MVPLLISVAIFSIAKHIAPGLEAISVFVFLSGWTFFKGVIRLTWKEWVAVAALLVAVAIWL
jgi:hypothetical protein